MKNIKFISILSAALLISVSCEQEVLTLTPPEVVTPDPGPDPVAGSANFTKFVAIGNSLTAGYQAGALFTAGQENSLAAIMAKQFAAVGGGAFNQPDINSANGFNTTTTNPPVPGGPILGRLVLFDPDGSGPRTPAPAALGTPARTATCPSTVETPAVPGSGGEVPAPYTGNKAALNNFGVPGILLGQVLTPLTGGPPTANPAYNPLYARFASNPGTSTILGDAIAANGSFFLFFLGNNDVLGYATTGGSGAIPLTSEAAFQGQYNAAIGQLLAAPGNMKGVVGNIPDVTTIPFFFTVTWNAIEFKSTDPTAEATLAQLNGLTGFGGYNAALDGLVAASAIPASEAAKRKVSYKIGKNGILIKDKTLIDLTSALSGINPALAPYGQVRQATEKDLITLSAGSILGTCAIPPGGTTPSPSFINGVSNPLGDQFVLLESEIIEIKTRTAAFNAIIKAAADGSGGRIALADVNAAFANLVAAKVSVQNGVTLTPSFAPPTGGFSEDGVHPNSRGYAFLANIFIDAINAKFGSTVPKASLADYSGTSLPLNP